MRRYKVGISEAAMKIEGEPTKRFKVTYANEVVGQFDTAEEVRAFVKKRLDRVYQIYDRRQPVKVSDLWD